MEYSFRSLIIEIYTGAKPEWIHVRGGLTTVFQPAEISDMAIRKRDVGATVVTEIQKLGS
jgi:hypothetical protein